MPDIPSYDVCLCGITFLLPTSTILHGCPRIKLSRDGTFYCVQIYHLPFLQTPTNPVYRVDRPLYFPPHNLLQSTQFIHQLIQLTKPKAYKFTNAPNKAVTALKTN